MLKRNEELEKQTNLLVGMFKEPEKIKHIIEGNEFEFLKEVPFEAGARVADIWMKMISGVAVNQEDVQLTLVELLVSASIKPKLTRGFLTHPNCPMDFLKISMDYYGQVMQGLNDTSEYNDESEIKDDEIDDIIDVD